MSISMHWVDWLALLAQFMLLSLITRGGRFMMLAGLIVWKGEVAKDFIEKRLEVALIAFLIFIGAGAFAAKYLF